MTYIWMNERKMVVIHNLCVKGRKEIKDGGADLNAEEEHFSRKHKLCHMKGKTSTTTELKLDSINYKAENCYRIRVRSWMYQKVEHVTKVKTGQQDANGNDLYQDEYTYTDEWCQTKQDSRNFHN